ncbi:MAG TPA: hypothetical protein PLL98_12115, partial [Bacillota bacterium]|nr:hypothetical protein [Bacillota bacterium]
TRVTSIAALEGLDSLRMLMIRETPLETLDNIELHPMLEQIYLSGTHLLDLSPLLGLPRLQLAEVSESMRSAAEDIEKEAGFKIIYQE